MIAIPAHNEAGVIKTTVCRLLVIDYPAHLFSIHIIAWFDRSGLPAHRRS